MPYIKDYKLCQYTHICHAYDYMYNEAHLPKFFITVEPTPLAHIDQDWDKEIW